MKSHFRHFVLMSADSDFQHKITTPLQWRWLLNLGISFLLCGLLAIAIPQFVTTAINLILGIILLFVGIVSGLYAYRIRIFFTDMWPLITSLALLILGLLLLFFPKFGAVSITLMIAVFFIFSGLGKLALAQIISPHSLNRWIIFSALIDLSLSLLIFFNLQNMSAWLLGVLVGISLILQGLWNIRLALLIRKKIGIYFDEI